MSEDQFGQNRPGKLDYTNRPTKKVFTEEIFMKGYKLAIAGGLRLREDIPRPPWIDDEGNDTRKKRNA